MCEPFYEQDCALSKRIVPLRARKHKQTVCIVLHTH